MVDFMNPKNEKEMNYNEHTMGITSSFEPSIADEVEYTPPLDTSEDLDMASLNLEVNEGTNEYNHNLIKKIHPSLIESGKNLPGEKLLYRNKCKNHSMDRKNLCQQFDMKNQFSLTNHSTTPNILQSTINLGNFK